MDYNFNEIEVKWRKYWAENKTYKAEEIEGKPKFYVLDMFPYPSGAGLHVGHPLGYIASDVFARYKKLKGFNVLHPSGYDSFGLPAEQYAIQTGQHPAVTTEKNIERYREQLDKIGFSFDWSREVRTSDPAYYKWTQWIFKQMFDCWYNKESDKAERISVLISKFEAEGNANVKAATDYEEVFSSSDWQSFSEKEKSDLLFQYRLTYLDDAWVNWCPALGTVLANDEIKDGVSERGGHPVVQKQMRQWMMRISAYANRLLTGLEKIDWTDSVKDIQRNWIGKSKGASLKFEVLTSVLSGGEEAMLGVVDTSDDVGKEGVYSKETSSTGSYLTGDPNISSLLLKKAKEMRANPTAAEEHLWEYLKGRKIDSKFRRQHIVDRFIPDFVCLDKRLIIEVDGDIHDHQEGQDRERTDVLNELGYKVLRFKNEVVLNEIDSVLEEIISELTQRESIKENSKVLPFGKDLGWDKELYIEVFTTRPDTIFGVSFMTLAPEHGLVAEITTPEQKEAIDAYIEAASLKTERDRQADVKNITGVFTGAYAIHPFSKEKIQIWIGDYVLASYGTGAVMAVPCGDQRDYDFAKHFDIKIINIFKDVDISEGACEDKNAVITNSDFLNDLPGKKAVGVAIKKIQELGIGKGKTNFRLRDAVFSRQRYWGEPFPVYYENDIPKMVADENLPIELPKVDKYLPTEDGEPPLARAEKEDWKHFQGDHMEFNTMPGWAGSSWYFMRYTDPNNIDEFASREKLDYWGNVDLYIGGAEHCTGHLLYSRFWTKFLYDQEYISFDEPFQKMINQGMILGSSSFVYRLELATYLIPGIEDSSELPSVKKFPEIFVSKEIYDDWANNEKLNMHAHQVKSKLELILISLIDDASRMNLSNVSWEYSFTRLHADISMVDNDVLDVELFKSWRKDYNNAEFILNSEGKYICGQEVEKMSKSKFNVQTPDELVDKYGADTLRLYEMFLGPLEQSKPWDTKGISGVHNFLRKLWRLFHDEQNNVAISDEKPNEKELKTLHKTIKKIQEDLERFSFNTGVSNFMIAVNELTEYKCNKKEILEPLLVLISSYAPHICEELWEKIGNTESITKAQFPVFEEQFLVEANFSYPVSFNGKMRFKLELPTNLSKEDVEKEVMEHELSAKWLDGKAPKKVIVVPGRIVNIVV